MPVANKVGSSRFNFGAHPKRNPSSGSGWLSSKHHPKKVTNLEARGCFGMCELRLLPPDNYGLALFFCFLCGVALLSMVSTGNQRENQRHTSCSGPCNSQRSIIPIGRGDQTRKARERETTWKPKGAKGNPKRSAKRHLRSCSLEEHFWWKPKEHRRFGGKPRLLVP